MDKLNWFFKQRVAALEMLEAFDKAEAADLALMTDMFTGGFLLSAVSVVETGPQSTSVDVGSILGYDTLGQRVEEAAQSFSFAGDDDPALVTPARLYVKFIRDESDPRVDGLNNNLNFKLDEGAELQRDLGTPGGGLPALRTDGSILLANINIPAAAAVITNADIDTSVQNLRTGLKASQLADTLNAVTRGYISNVKIVALTGTTVDVERATAVPSGASPDILMNVKNETLDLSAPPGPGGLDIGAVIDATYYVYLIGDSQNPGVNDSVCASLDPGPGFGGVGPDLSTNFPNQDRFRLIGVISRFGGAIIPFRQIGEEFMYDDYLQTLAFPAGLDPHVGVAPTPYVALSLAPYVAPIAERAYLHFDLATTAITGPMYGFRSRGGPAIAGRTALVGGGAGGSLSNNSNSFLTVHVDTLQRVDWNRERLAVPNNHTVEVGVLGFHLDLHHD